MNELSMTERETIIGLLRLRWTQRRIERETGHRRETIARIGREAGLLPAKPAKVLTDHGDAISDGNNACEAGPSSATSYSGLRKPVG